MATAKQLATTYAERIINSKDKLDTIIQVYIEIEKIKYENSEKEISYEHQDEIWDEIEELVRKVEQSQINTLFEQTNTSTLSLISNVRGSKKKKRKKK